MKKIDPHNRVAEKAKTFLRRRQFDQAIMLIDRARDLAPPDAPFSDLETIKFTKAKILLLKGHFYRLPEFLEQGSTLLRSLNGHSNIPESCILIEKGTYEFYTKSYDKAYEYFKKALELAEASKDNGEKIEALITLGWYFTERNNLKKSQEYIKQAHKLLNNKTPLDLVNSANQALLSIYIRTNQFNKIPELAQIVLEDSRRLNDAENEIKALNALGVAHAIKGEYKSAFEYFSKVREKSESIKFDHYIAKALANLGNIFSKLYNHNEAIKHFSRAVQEFPHILVGYRLGVTYHNLGGIYVQKEEHDKALPYFFKALEVGKSTGYNLLISRSLFEITRTFINLDNIEEALNYSAEAAKYSEGIESVHNDEINLANLAYINYYQKNLDAALEYAEKCIAKCLEVHNNRTLIRVYDLTSKIYQEKEDFEKANKYLRSYAESVEENTKEIRRRQMLDLEIRYEIQEKERQITQLKNKMQLQELRLSHQKQLEEQNIKLRNANEDLKQFTYAVSHDLRAPIRTISSFTYMLNEELEDHLDEETKQYFDLVTSSSERMGSMLEGLLQFATIGTKESDFSYVNLQEVANNVTNSLYVMIKENDAHVQFKDILPMVYTNQILISQLFQNLLSNAIKFRKKDVAPVVNVHYEEKPNAFIFSVQDNGIGIAKKNQDSIFKIFKRLHRNEEYAGTGIGLSMCKKIVNNLRGEIWLESEEGVGTTFFVKLPKPKE